MNDLDAIDDIINVSKSQILPYAFFRIESAIVVAGSLLMTGLCLLDLFWLPEMWWAWLLFGVLAETAIVVTTLKDQKVTHEIASKLFYERYSGSNLKSLELKDIIRTVLDLHRASCSALMRQQNQGLAVISVGLDRWALQSYRVANGLDTLLNPGTSSDMFRKVGLPKARSFATVEDFIHALHTVDSPSMEFLDEHVLEQEHSRVQLYQSVLVAKDQLDNTVQVMSTVRKQLGQNANHEMVTGYAQLVNANIADQVQRLMVCGNNLDKSRKQVEVMISR